MKWMKSSSLKLSGWAEAKFVNEPISPVTQRNCPSMNWSLRPIHPPLLPMVGFTRSSAVFSNALVIVSKCPPRLSASALASAQVKLPLMTLIRPKPISNPSLRVSPSVSASLGSVPKIDSLPSGIKSSSVSGSSGLVAAAISAPSLRKSSSVSASLPFVPAAISCALLSPSPSGSSLASSRKGSVPERISWPLGMPSLSESSSTPRTNTFTEVEAISKPPEVAYKSARSGRTPAESPSGEGTVMIRENGGLASTPCWESFTKNRTSRGERKPKPSETVTVSG